jgi:hypothetical protein
MVFNLSEIGFAKTDDTDTPSDRGEAQHVQAMRMKSNCNNNLTLRLRRYRANDASMLGPSRGTNVQH